MQARLDGGAFYIALDIFTADLRRMCANARIYNAAHTIYVQYANRARRPTIILTPPHACRRALALTAARAHRLRAFALRRASLPVRLACVGLRPPAAERAAETAVPAADRGVPGPVPAGACRAKGVRGRAPQRELRPAAARPVQGKPTCRALASCGS